MFGSSLRVILVIMLSGNALAQTDVRHPLLSAPGGPYSIGGDGNEYLVHGISNRAFFYLRAKWPTDPDGITRIGVCWEAPSGEHEKFRQIVKSAIDRTWQFYSGIKFVNWGACTNADTKAIRISVGDFWPQSLVGNSVAGKSAGMKLNFNFTAPSDWTFCRSTAEACIYKLAVHEFGHAIGFMHEQARQDTPDACIAAQAGEGQVAIDRPGFTTAGTPWDAGSVMNYCNVTWNNNGQLSDLDIYALQRVYGVPK